MDPRLAPDTFWPRLQRALAQVPEDARTPPPDGRVGAVLVLLEDTPAGPRVVLTRRRADLKSHPGQLSFAGGRLDADETIEEAALREAEEEIGLRRSTTELLGVGPKFFIPPSKFWVVPVFARWREPHALDPNPWEVDAILEVPIARLLEPDRFRHVPLSDRGSSWAWQLDDDVLWGATAIVMAILLEVAVEDWSGGLTPETLGEDRAVFPWEDAPRVPRRQRIEGLPEVLQSALPHVTRAQMAEVDRLLRELGLPLEALVEHAGRGVAHAVRRLVGGDTSDARVTVVAGTGGNGAGGLAAAKLLAVAGADVEVRLLGDVQLAGQLRALESCGVALSAFDDQVTPRDVVIDAMIGYSMRPPLRGAAMAAVEWLDRNDVPVVSVDLPSGMLADKGLEGRCVTADVTVTVAAPKQGMAKPITQPYLGDVYLADIGVPAGVWRAVGVEPFDAFREGPLVRLTVAAAAPDAGTPDQGTEPG